VTRRNEAAHAARRARLSAGGGFQSVKFSALSGTIVKITYVMEARGRSDRWAYTDLAIAPPKMDEFDTLDLYHATAGGEAALIFARAYVPPTRPPLRPARHHDSQTAETSSDITISICFSILITLEIANETMRGLLLQTACCTSPRGCT
jgi:hypothetical protein